MHPGINGPKFKDKPALIMAGSGDVITHQELNELSRSTIVQITWSQAW